MTKHTGDDLDQPTSGRFVRNLALSLSGGALLTLLGATAAHAQDAAQAGTDSAGTGAAHSGDANAVGNQSGTNNTQTVTVSGNLGTIQVINQQANVSNTGAAVANTGGNIAIGNASNNTAAANQASGSDTGAAANNGQAQNGSNGSATISTGNASAVGNVSNTTINQEAHGSAHGQLGGILVINQDATVINSGVALANSGGNAAVGNGSLNNAGLVQSAATAAGISSNNGKATNGSDGKATINTGGASATGNRSNTSITQSASGSAGGELGGLVIIDQDANVLNLGAAVANSGGNIAAGNVSGRLGAPNTAGVNQTIGAPLPADPTDPIGVASNNGEASNWSDGTAGIKTGDASAIGNDSTTTVKQNADATIQGDGGLTLVNQDSNVLNAGLAIANSGGNAAVGNASSNQAGLTQTAPAGGAIDVGVIGNFGLASNESDGTGLISTGAASATGNRSKTDVSQNAKTEGGGLNLYTQGNLVTNTGLSVANSGLNGAVGNVSTNGANVAQAASLPPSGVQVGVIGNFGKAGNSSDGTAAIATGNASAIGNDSSTKISQDIDPNGLVIPVQTAVVVNAGVGLANSGGNVAVGNVSQNAAGLSQAANIGSNNAGTTNILAGTLVSSSNGEASNTSDGSAAIKTGNATASGNKSDTEIDQTSTGSVDGLGLVLNTQTAGVLNTGLGVANSGVNGAIGNASQNNVGATQTANVGSNNGGKGDVNVLAGILTASNQGTASNTSDGTATISTGDASGKGNQSATRIRQNEDGSVDGLGAVINTQVAGVANVGLGVGNSGGNLAVGNVSSNAAALGQTANVGSGNNNGGDVNIVAPILTANNGGKAENVSDGTAEITTGAASGTGNTSATDLVQAQKGDVDGLGLVVNTQVAGVANAGVGIANSGVNAAVGNASGRLVAPNTAVVSQGANVGSLNGPGVGDVNILAAGPLTASNSGTASNTSDGTGKVHTGGAQADGNVSTTALSQFQDGTIDTIGAAVNTQVGGVANVGLAVANSGVNGAVGNASTNVAALGETANIGSNNSGGTVGIAALGPLTAANSGEASNTSDGSALVGTGGALATGNASATNLHQHQSTDVEDLGLIVSTQAGGVANVGVGIANSGVNAAVGNVSTNVSQASQNALFASNNAAPPAPVVVVGPLSAVNNGQATNSSDGEACVCTGNAVASGNVSSTTLIQDLDTSVGTGLIVMTEAGGVLNAGLGLANSGLNLAVGNVSNNTAVAAQNSTINDAILPASIVGPQTAHNGGGANNSSDGAGKVGSGNAKAVGNQSTTNFVQAAAVDSDFAVATLAGGTTNTGLGLANSGLNLGIGNASTNVAVLQQNADGAGLVSNDGTADNDSDGTATIGDPNCDVPGTPPGTKTNTPGVASLPKTGGPIEAEALFGLMLLLAGFGLRRKGNSLA